MNLLAFDTSTDTLFIAIQRGDQLWQHQAAGGANSSATLIPAIQAGLQALDLKLVDLKAIVFGRGPGSFTGLRTSCAIAQGLAFGRGAAPAAYRHLAGRRGEARLQHGCTDVMAVLDARMSEVYHAGYRWATACGRPRTRWACGAARSLDRARPRRGGGQCPKPPIQTVWPLRPSTWPPCPRRPHCFVWRPR